MTQQKKFYSLSVNGTEAQLDIYGDISSWCRDEDDSGMSAFKLSKQLEQLVGVSIIYVNINSYGGEVSEGVAIYNALRRHSAKIITRCDGMACSIASVIFMAGEVRQMYRSSMLMIHNASTYAWGNAAELRKVADDAEKITSMSKAAYLEHVNLSEEDLSALMDAETWIDPTEALEWSFATEIIDDDKESNHSQSARASLMQMIKLAMQVKDDDDDNDAETNDDNTADDDDDSAELDDDSTNDDDNEASDDDNTADDDDDDDEDDKPSQQFRSLIQQAFSSLERF